MVIQRLLQIDPLILFGAVFMHTPQANTSLQRFMDAAVSTKSSVSR